MTLLSPDLLSELAILYELPPRRYHSLSHITALRNLLADHRSRFSDPDAVEAAIWYHDAIYEAETARLDLGEGLEGPEVEDAKLFLDMDLSILGASEKEFDEYEAAVRKEYKHTGNAAWEQGRAEVLFKFLEREWIFHSELFRELYEDKARKNLRRSLKRLGY
ncbi:hypothetical protein N0V88_003834 [Collariella sp. IMI 366227]|nr:hypothetical protein N0V88_003834 [Collariella sp. IMI 366227]